MSQQRRLIIPELELRNLLAAVLEYLRVQTQQQVGIFNHWFDVNGQSLRGGRFDYGVEAREIFGRGVDDPRSLHLSVGYNVERQGLPTIHIMLPGEQAQSSIGNNLGYGDPVIRIVEDVNGEEQTYVADTYSLQVDTTYQVMITSDNAQEAIIVYHVLRAILTSLTPDLEERGIRNVSYAGADLQFDESIVPRGVFHRNLLLKFFYETFTPQLDYERVGQDIVVTGSIALEDQI